MQTVDQAKISKARERRKGAVIDFLLSMASYMVKRSCTPVNILDQCLFLVSECLLEYE